MFADTFSLYAQRLGMIANTFSLRGRPRINQRPALVRLVPDVLLQEPVREHERDHEDRRADQHVQPEDIPDDHHRHCHDPEHPADQPPAVGLLPEPRERSGR